MNKKYAIYGFSYIDNKSGVNTLNGTKGADWKECDDDYNIVCFDGLAYYKSPMGYFKMTYPKFNTLTWEDKDEIEGYCGYYPYGGEYGAVCCVFGTTKRISKAEFNRLCNEYPIKKKDYKMLVWA